MRIGLCALSLLLLLVGPALSQDATCCACGQPILGKGYRLPDGRTVCEAHLDSVLPHCALCGQALKESYSVVGPRQAPICQTCLESHPLCWICGEPVPPKHGRRLKDGRVLCDVDRKTAIFSPDAARRLFDQARREVIKTLGRALVAPVEVGQVSLVDASQMERVARGSGPSGMKPPSGLTRVKATEVGGERRHHPAHVFLMSGLPKEEFLTVAAHEYAHAWHAQAHPDYFRCSRRLREGFAEWVAYKVVDKLHRREQMAQLLAGKSDPDYSEGLKQVLTLEQSVGPQGVLEYVTSHDDL